MKSTYLLSAVAVSALLISSPSMAYEKNKHVTKTDNGRVIDRTYQTQKGEVKSHNEITKNGNGGWNGTRTVTGPDGKTKTITTEGAKTENGFTKTQTWTDKDGAQKSRTVEQQRNADGTVTHTVTDPNGQVHTNTAQNGKMARQEFRQERRAQWRDKRAQGGQVGNQ